MSSQKGKTQRKYYSLRNSLQKKEELAKTKNSKILKLFSLSILFFFLKTEVIVFFK
jgi:hypothetical protein